MMARLLIVGMFIAVLGAAAGACLTVTGSTAWLITHQPHWATLALLGVLLWVVCAATALASADLCDRLLEDQ